MPDSPYGSRRPSPERPDYTKNTDKGTTPRRIIGERDLTSTTDNREAVTSMQVVRNAAELSTSQEGRNRLQEIINDQQNKAFNSQWASLMEAKAIPVPPDFQASLAEYQEVLNRRMYVDEVIELWGKDVAKAFGIRRGLTAEEKSEQARYSEAFHNTFSGKYFTEAIWVSGSLFRVTSQSGEFGKCESVINLAEGSIDINDGEVKRNPGALHISQFSGEQWLYVLSKIKDGRDDNGTEVKIHPSEASTYIFRELRHSMITNGEFKSTIRQLVLRGRRKGTISITKDTPEGTDDFLIVEGTPNGHAAPFLPKEYQHVFGNIKCTEIKLDLEDTTSGSVNIDKVRFCYTPAPS